ncbi:RNA-binding transcriptional accessory protein [Pendulispora brunnea]|uniref:RNA-binding transcriptional accessory protein n=1 Tax=Pendulispora brunnea TaxID=2905690 RepID=A0ABZ2K0M3_9BACT
MTAPEVPVENAFDPVPAIAEELKLAPAAVRAVVKLLEEGATVPFIARYRKEATGGLDEVQIRTIEERRTYLLELHERRTAILSEISSQGKLTPELKKKIEAAGTKAELEDLYLPYKPKRRTRATIAKERGLEPLANLIWSQAREGHPLVNAATYVDPAKEVPDVQAALAGARDICAERVAEHAEVRKMVRETFAQHASLSVSKTKDYADKTTKFDAYAKFEEPVSSIPSHRFLAIRRGENEGVLRASIELAAEVVLPKIERMVGIVQGTPFAGELTQATQDAYKRLIVPSTQVDVRVELKLRSDRAAVDVFAQNLRELLLAAPFGPRTVLAIDPGQRTGCKCAMVDATGKVLAHETIYLVQGAEATERGKKVLRELLGKHRPSAVAVGNGTHGRETELFVRELLVAEGLKEVPCVSVSEAGASVYSASDIAREEFPDLDLTVRGAISIARRLQDPLAELVKIDPKSIGVGQYQHDVLQTLLARKLDEVVESCVNRVGVELNTASAPLLARVAGIGASLAKKIVEFRHARGAFKDRRALLEVPGVGPRTFEQAAGFLRIHGGENPLDASAVHPERYPLVERMATDLGVPVGTLVGKGDLIDKIDPKRYQEGDVGSFTLQDILSELRKPGRDPRATFEPPKFRDDVRTMEDLKPDMELEGVVTNVTAFGAFVDIGVHQDGLVHVSKLTDRYVKDPNEVVKVGDKIKVRVLEVDLGRKRISLTARKEASANVGGAHGKQPPPQTRNQGQGRNDRGRGQGPKQGGAPRPQEKAFTNNPFEKLLRNNKP